MGMRKRNPLGVKYVNNMLNACYLTGFVRNPVKDEGFLLQQTNNLAQAIPIVVSTGAIIPSEFTPVTVLCHLYGERRTHTSDGVVEPNLQLKMIDLQKPSTRAMPAMTAWSRHNDAKEAPFQPFLPPPNKPSQGGYSAAEQTLQDILQATRGRLDTRLGSNANVALLAGFVHSSRYIQPNPYQKHGYGLLLIRQHRDTDLALPVRLYNRLARQILDSITIGQPVSFSGQIRMKVLPNDQGEIRHRNLHLRVDEVYQADRERDIRIVPKWWGEENRSSPLC